MFDYAVYLTVLALGLVIANAIANKKISLVSIILSLLCIALFLTSHIVALGNLYKSIDTTDKYLYYFIISVLASVTSTASLLYYSYNKRNINKLFEIAATFDSDKVIAVANKKGKLLKSSSKLENIIEKLDGAPTDFNLAIVKIIVDDKEYDKKLLACFKNILKDIVLSQIEENVSFVYSNGLVIDINIGIEEVKIKDKVYGYALFDKNIIASDNYKETIDRASKRRTFIYLDMLDADVAYYDDVVKKYILTNHFFTSLGLNYKEDAINSVSKDELEQFVYPEDLDAFKNAKPIHTKVLKVYYRLRLINDYEWFEESIFEDKENREYHIIRRVDAMIASKIRYGNYKGFVKQIESLCTDKKDFGIIMINLFSLPKITADIGKEMSDLVVSNYFSKIVNGILCDACKVYKISVIEYALVVDDIKVLNVVKRDLVENNSLLTRSEIMLNNLNVTMEAEVGLVDTGEVSEVNSKDMARIAFDMLKQASDPTYIKNYSIYNKTTPVNLDYSLADLGIDLDEDLSIYDEEEANDN